MALPSLLSVAQQTQYRDAISSVFWTFARPFDLYVNAQTVVISTSPTYSRFGFHDQNAPITEDNSAVSPQVYTVTGCILYGNNQPWPYISPDVGGDAQQLKLRDSDGKVRIKVEQQGYDLMKDAKTVVLDGFTFNLVSTARPHGIVGSPDRWTFTCEKTS